jgi:hypothetical protein
MLFLFLSVVAGEITSFNQPLLAAQSDYGILTLHNASTGVPQDANIYFVDSLDMTNKIHVIVGVTDCICAGFGDAEKINQLDYLAVMHYMFSFGVYLSYNIPHRAKCGLAAEVIQKRTSLYWNAVGTGLPVSGVHHNIWTPVPQHKPGEDWIEGPVIYAGMRDFRQHSYVTTHSDQIYGTDKSGGILYVQGTVFMRPCLLWPWYTPWILDSYGADAYTLNLLPPFSITPYLNASDAELFYETTAALKEKGVITDKHMANLKDNNGNSGNRAHVFRFQAIFVPHRFVGEFLVLLEGYKDTSLASYVYVPFIFQLLWDKNSWSHITSARNDTIYASPNYVLNSCMGDTVEMTMENINAEVVKQLSYFAYGWCGWPSPINQIAYIIKDEIKYITKTAKIYFMYHLYEVVFWIVVAMTGICFLWCIRRRIYDLYLKLKLKFPLFRGYRKMHIPYIPNKQNHQTRNATYAMSEFETDGGDDDFDDDDKKESIKAQAHMDV